jgi:hypothetical protein
VNLSSVLFYWRQGAIFPSVYKRTLIP